MDYQLPSSDEQLLKECILETLKASGAGGQHVNKTQSAVRLTHLPTGLQVKMQVHKSQFQNKLEALRVLRFKIQKLLYKPKKRIATKLSRSKKNQNLDSKKKHSQKKQSRGKINY